jgi:hypothetical protein
MITGVGLPKDETGGPFIVSCLESLEGVLKDNTSRDGWSNPTMPLNHDEAAQDFRDP